MYVNKEMMPARPRGREEKCPTCFFTKWCNHFVAEAFDFYSVKHLVL